MRWETKYPIDYSPNGDDIDAMAQKVKAEFSLIYHLLNKLRQNAAASGDLKDTLPYEFHVDTASGKMFMRNSKDDGWVVIGDTDKDYFGIKPSDIGAVATDGTVGKMSAGNVTEMATLTANRGDLFFALDERRIYSYSGTSWDLFLSLNFTDLYDYKNNCVLREEIGYNGKDKILRLDASTGKGNIDISGSAERLLGYKIEVANLKDGQVLAFDNSAQKFVNKPKDEITDAEISDSGAASKIVKTDSKGIANISISGSAAKVDGVEVNTAGIVNNQTLAYNANYKRFEPATTLKADISGSAEYLSGIGIDAANLVDDQFLVYDSKSKKIVSDKKEYLNESDVSNSGEPDKIIRLGSDGIIRANLDGSATKIDGIEVDNAGVKNGQVLAYDAANKKYIPANKDYITEDKISESGEIGKLVKLGSDKTIHANVDGSVSKIDNVAFNLENITSGDLLSYDAKTKKIIPVAKDTNATSLNQIVVDTTNLSDGQVDRNYLVAAKFIFL